MHYTHTYTCTHNAHAHTYTHTYVYTHIHIYTYIHKHTDIHNVHSHVMYLDHLLWEEPGLEESQEAVKQVLPALPQDVSVAVGQGEHGLYALTRLWVHP